MRTRHAGGSAGDADHGRIGVSYTRYRQSEPEIARLVHEALGDARTVLNVGAGAGSYEPTDRLVTAAQLPFADRSFEAAMAAFTVHQWPDLAKGLGEVRRVTSGPIAVLTCDPATLRTFWLNEYAPEVINVEARRHPPIERLVNALGRCGVTPTPIPLNCGDGFNEAYYGRPERPLDPGARLANSAWSFVADPVQRRFADHLARDLADGSWDKRFGQLRGQARFVGSLVLVVGY
jgi:hypothetical protein